MADPKGDEGDVGPAGPAGTSDVYEAASPAGALLTRDGERRAFSGWQQLASVIEDWRQTHEHEQHPSHRRR